MLITELEKLCAAAKPNPIKANQMIKPVETWWNSKSHMLRRALELRLALEDLCSMSSLKKQFNTGHLRLSDAEWEVATQLEPLLDVSSRCLPHSIHLTLMCL